MTLDFKNNEFLNPATVPGAIVIAILFGLIAWLIGRALRHGIQRVLAYDYRAAFDKTSIRFLGQIAQISIYVFAFISYTHLVPALSGLGNTWLASASIISVIIGLAAQSTLGNLISGFALVLYRPFNVGDRLALATPNGVESGTVESINLGYTVIGTDDNRHIVLPNMAVAGQTLIKLNGTNPRALCSFELPLSHDADVRKVKNLLTILLEQHPKIASIVVCAVTQATPMGLVFSISVWCTDSNTAGQLKLELLDASLRILAESNIKLARQLETSQNLHAKS